MQAALQRWQLPVQEGGAQLAAVVVRASALATVVPVGSLLTVPSHAAQPVKPEPGVIGRNTRRAAYQNSADEQRPQ